MTQDDYKLFTGQTVSYSSENWATIVAVAEERLASFLCLDTFPTLDETNKDLELLLANFLCATLKFQGAEDTLASKSVRNFTISFKSSAANAFEQIYSQYRDIIEKYSNCGLKIKVERSDRRCCGFYNNGYFNF